MVDWTYISHTPLPSHDTCAGKSPIDHTARQTLGLWAASWLDGILGGQRVQRLEPLRI